MTTSSEDVSTQSIHLCKGFDDLAAVRDFCKQLIASSFVDTKKETDEVVGSLQLAVTEAMVNVTKHGYEGVSEKPIECRGRTSASSLSIDILHHGKAFEPDFIPEITEPQENGMGLFLMEQCVDQVEYWQESDGRQCITLTIHF